MTRLKNTLRARHIFASLKRRAKPGLRRRMALAFVLAVVLPVVLLRWIPPATSMFMLIACASAVADGDAGYVTRYEWKPLEEISGQAALAVIAAEDQNFTGHIGFDFAAMKKAFFRNQKSGKVRGASTISQQTAKNLFLYPGRSYFRKALEAGFTSLIELAWPKRRILEIYLNIAEFGKGIYGVEAASQAWFGKPAKRLTAPEAALLASVLPNPTLLKANRPSHYVQRRQQWILGQMRRLSAQGTLEELAP